MAAAAAEKEDEAAREAAREKEEEAAREKEEEAAREPDAVNPERRRIGAQREASRMVDAARAGMCRPGGRRG